jgi:hypothetical protein
MSDIMDMINKIPTFTRFYMGSAFFMAFVVTYRIINIYYLLLDFEKVFWSLQVSHNTFISSYDLIF